MAVQRVVNEVAFVLKSFHVVRMAWVYYIGYHFDERYNVDDVVNVRFAAVVCSSLLERMVQHMWNPVQWKMWGKKKVNKVV